MSAFIEMRSGVRPKQHSCLLRLHKGTLRIEISPACSLQIHDLYQQQLHSKFKYFCSAAPWLSSQTRKDCSLRSGQEVEEQLRYWRSSQFPLNLIASSFPSLWDLCYLGPVFLQVLLSRQTRRKSKITLLGKMQGEDWMLQFLASWSSAVDSSPSSVLASTIATMRKKSM